MGCPSLQPVHRRRPCSAGRTAALLRLAGLTVLAIVPGCQQPAERSIAPQALRVNNVSGYLEFMTRQREEEQKSKVGAGDIHQQESIFQESVRLDTAGSVYHPNLMEFTLGGLFGLLQHSFRDERSNSRLSGSDDGTVLEYDFTGDFLKKKPYPGSVYAHRRQATEPREFQSSVETTADNYGALWQYLSDKMPTRLQFDYTDLHFHPFDSSQAESERKNLDLRFDTAYKFNEHNVLSFLYEHQSVNEQSHGDQPYKLAYDSDELTVRHRFEFGEQHQHRLESEFDYFKQQGSIEEDRLRWRETLRLKHSDTLRSWYELELQDQTRGSLGDLPPITEQSYRFTGTVEHRLFDSLVSQLIAMAQRQDFKAGAEIDRYAVEARFDYTKKNPLGVLRANYNARLEKEERQGNQLRAEIRDEPHTFRDPEPIVVDNPSLVAGTIVVKAQDRITFYQVGRDYTLRTVGDRVEIERVPTGRITDGQTVLVDYVYSLGGSFKLDTVNQNFGIRQDFKFGLSPYYRLRRQDQSVTPQTATGVVPEDITANIVGVEYRWKTFDASAEYEDHASSINSFDALRLRAGYSHRFPFNGTATLRATWSDVTYAPPRDRETKFLTLEGRYRQALFASKLTAEGAVVYRHVDDTQTGPQQGVDVTFSLEWFIRQIEIRLTGEYKQFDDDFAKNTSSTLWLQVRRKF